MSQPAASTVREKKVSKAEYSLAGSKPCKSALLFFSSPATVPRHSTATVLSSSPHMLPAHKCLVTPEAKHTQSFCAQNWCKCCMIQKTTLHVEAQSRQVQAGKSLHNHLLCLCAALTCCKGQLILVVRAVPCSCGYPSVIRQHAHGRTSGEEEGHQN